MSSMLGCKCKFARLCGKDNCKLKHYPLLHKDEIATTTASEEIAILLLNKNNSNATAKTVSTLPNRSRRAAKS